VRAPKSDFFARRIDVRTKLSDIGSADRRGKWTSEIDLLPNSGRTLARKASASGSTKGKGGHAMVYVGDKLTTLPSREIDPKTARKIRKHLGLAE